MRSGQRESASVLSSFAPSVARGKSSVFGGGEALGSSRSATTRARVTMRKAPSMALAALPLIALLAATAGASAPGESACHKIKEADLKNYCLATVRNRESDCYRIKSADRQNFCVAQVRTQRTKCYAVKDADLRNLCLAWMDLDLAKVDR